MEIRQNYTNPLTMMKATKNNNHLGIKKQTDPQSEDKKADLQELQTKKQMVQSEMVLLKSTASNGEMPKDWENALDKKLEEVTKEIKAAQMENNQMDTSSETSPLNLSQRFDMYETTDESLNSSIGIYELTKDQDGTAKIIYTKPN